MVMCPWSPLKWSKKDNKLMKKSFTIIVPVYNEEDNLERVEKELSGYLNTCSLNAKRTVCKRRIYR